MNSQLKLFLSACIILSLCLINTKTRAQVTTKPIKTTSTAPSKSNPSPAKPNIKTAVFTINLCDPDTNTLSAQIHRIRLKANTGEPISFELKNGNPFKYKYVINTNMVSFFTSETNSFNSLDSLRKKVLQIQTNKTTPNLPDKIDSTNKEMASVKKDSSTNAKLKTQEAKNMVRSSHKQLTVLRQQFDSLANDYKQLNANINSIAQDSLYIAIRKKYLITSKNEPLLNKPDLNLKKNIDSIKKATLNNITAKAQLIALSISDLRDSLSTSKTEFGIEDCLNPDTLNLKKNNYKKRYFVLLDDLYRINQSAIDAGADDGLKSMLSDAKTQLLQAKITLSALCNVQLKNYTLPIDVNGKNIDLLKITLERHDAQNTTLIDKYEYQVWLNGGLKLDVSGGAFLTSLVDNKYYTTDSVAGGKKYIYKSNIGKYQIGFGTLLNISYRTGAAWVRPSINFGALFSNEQKFQLLAGVGAMLGKEQRVLLHFGLSMGAVNTIESSYTYSSPDSPTTRHAYDLGTSSVVPTTQKFQFGHYFGLTYNFGGAKAKTPGVKE